jgi:hydroxymethylbilane synthase
MASIYDRGSRLSNGVMTNPLIRIASRGSPLALTQSRIVRSALAAAHGWPGDELEALCPIIPIRTTGDRIQDRPLADAGGKGLFVKEIEEALLSGEADIAVHSMKDMPAVQPPGLVIAAVLERENPHDVFLGGDGQSFAQLKPNAKLGTSSVRRQAQALRARPDLAIVPLRGNVETRLAKLKRGEADGIMLARAGLSRLEIALPGAEVLSDWLPALCQGAIGVEIRERDDRAAELVAPIDHRQTHVAIACERGFLAALDGSCRTPIAGLATVQADRVRFNGEVLMPDGRKFWTAARDLAMGSSPEARGEAETAGREAAREILARAGDLLPRF